MLVVRGVKGAEKVRGQTDRSTQNWDVVLDLPASEMPSAASTGPLSGLPVLLDTVPHQNRRDGVQRPV